MLHQITIEAPPDEVFRALTEQDGLRRWWTSDSEAVPIEGSTSTFGFFERSTVFRMKINNLESPTFLKWTCVEGPSEWKDTELEFRLESTPGGHTVLTFRHYNWKSTEGFFSMCNTTWGHLMYTLKDYVELGASLPLFDS